MREVRVRRLTVGSIFKLIFVGSWIGSIPVFLFFGVLAASGVELLLWNGEYVTGWRALLGSPLLGLFLSTMSALIVASLTVVGHWIISRLGGLRLYCQLDGVDARADAEA